MTQAKTDTTRPRIYVISLADYSVGWVLARWIDADQSAEDIHREIVEMLAESKETVAEDWAIYDYENFGGLHLSEFESLEVVAEVAQLMTVHGTIFADLVAHFGGTSGTEEARRYMEDGYCGEFETLADYAEQLVEDCHGSAIVKLPDFIKYHIDYEGIARDMELSGDVFTIEHGGKVHVFWANL